MKLRLSPLPQALVLKPAESISRFFSGMVKLYPWLQADLAQSEIEIKPEVFVAMCFLEGLFSFFLIFGLISLLGVIFKGSTFVSRELPQWFPLMLVLSIISALIFFSKNLAIPKVLVMRRRRKIRKDLLPALKHLQIQLSSGVPLFHALSNVARGEYGEVSRELRRIVSEISGGKPLEKALEDSALRTPDPEYRRVIWQLVNAMRAGIEVGAIIKETLELLTEDRLAELRKYGRDLNPLTLMYMLLSVVFPAVGVTALIMVSSIAGALVSTAFLLALPFLLLAVQILFITVIRAKRPEVEL